MGKETLTAVELEPRDRLGNTFREFPSAEYAQPHQLIFCVSLAGISHSHSLTDYYCLYIPLKSLSLSLSTCIYQRGLSQVVGCSFLSQPNSLVKHPWFAPSLVRIPLLGSLGDGVGLKHCSNQSTQQSNLSQTRLLLALSQSLVTQLLALPLVRSFSPHATHRLLTLLTQTPSSLGPTPDLLAQTLLSNTPLDTNTQA